VPTHAFRTAWTKTTSVLQVLPAESRIGVTSANAGERTWDDTVPVDDDSQFLWASWWASRRLAAKQSRDFAEADRIRAMLAAAGWEVRDSRDGTATVQRK